MALQGFDEIYNGMLSAFGVSWLIWVVMGISFLMLVLFLFRGNVVLALPVFFMPIFILVFYQVIVVGWLMSIMIIIMGILLAIGLSKMFAR